MVVLNSNCAFVSGCGPGSDQDAWLRLDLAANPARCTLAYFHHPRFTSASGRTTDESVLPFWQALQQFGADVILNGHHHAYERFAPQRPDGALDRAAGIRQFTVGTGGYSYEWFGPRVPTSEVRIHGEYGILELTLHPSSYGWLLVPEAGKTEADSGTSACH